MQTYVLIPIEVWNGIIRQFEINDNALSALKRQNLDFIRWLSDYNPEIKYHKESGKWGRVHDERKAGKI